jgi:hypothetical protein
MKSALAPFSYLVLILFTFSELHSIGFNLKHGKSNLSSFSSSKIAESYIVNVSDDVSVSRVGQARPVDLQNLVGNLQVSLVRRRTYKKKNTLAYFDIHR